MTVRTREILLARLHSSIVINRPVEEVFAYLTDIQKNVDYRAGVISAEITSTGPQTVGSTFRFSIRVMGTTLEAAAEVTEHESLKRYAWRSTAGCFPISGSTTFEPAEGGTRVIDEIEAEPGDFFKLAKPLRIQQQQSLIEAGMRRAKEILEGGAK